MEAAEAVAADSGIGVLDGVSALVENSLLREEDGPGGEPRYLLLETVREFGMDRLAAGEAAAVGRSHADYFVAVVERSDPGLVAGNADATGALRAERDNLRAAQEWLLAHDEAETVLRVAGILSEFWAYGGEFAEGRARLDRALALAPAAPPAVAAAGFYGLAILAHFQGDYTAGRTAAEKALALARSTADAEGEIKAQFALSVIGHSEGRSERALASAWAAVALAREVNATAWLAWSLQQLGVETHGQGDPAGAAALPEESIALFRVEGSHWGEAHGLHGLAAVARDLGEPDHAAALYGDSLTIFEAIGSSWGVADILVALADIAESRGQADKAARLVGAADARRGVIGYALMGNSLRHTRRVQAALRERLGESEYAAQRDRGLRLPPAEAVALARSVASGLAAVSLPCRDGPTSLTPRERDVLPLLVEGRSDKQIAEALFIGPRTVQTHVANLFAKLGVNSRAVAAAVAVRRGLV